MGFHVCPPPQDGYTLLGEEYQSDCFASTGRPVFMSMPEAQLMYVNVFADKSLPVSRSST